MVSSYSFFNIINNEFYKVLEEVSINWNEYSLHRSGRDIIIEKDQMNFYTNSNVKKLYSIEDISRTIKKIESTSYRSAKIKELDLTNYRSIFDILQRYDRQKKLTLLLK